VKKFLLTLLLILGIGYVVLSQDFKKTPDTLYYNADIISMNQQAPTAQAMLVQNGVITAIGSNTELEQNTASNIQRINLKGQTLMPGFIDSHTHVALSAFLESMVDLSGFTHQSNQQVWQHLKQAVTKAKPGEWIIAKGLDPILVPDLQTPDKQFLDRIAPDNPVVILSQSLHTYWVNSLALQKAGITKITPNPSAASYYQKNSQGELTGLIAEQEAFLPIYTQLLAEALTPEVLVASTLKVLQGYAKNGNTTVVSAGISIADKKPLRLYQHLSDQKPQLLNQLLSRFGLLPVRTPNPRHFLYMRFDRETLMPEKKVQNDFYNILGVKHWYDGSPYTGSMYLREPYVVSELSDKGLHIKPGQSGKALVAKNNLKNFIKKYHQAGWQIAIHAQGDKANADVLEVFSAVQSDIDITQGRHRLEHCLLIEPQSLQILNALNMTPNFHINHLYYYGQALEQDIIGSKRANNMLPLGSAQSMGLKFAMHADQPMFASKPLRLIQTALERKTKEGELLGVDQSINIQQALKAMTLNAAWQINMENKIGSLEVGKYADFIVLDKSPLHVPVAELGDIQILQSFVHGNRVKK